MNRLTSTAMLLLLAVAILAPVCAAYSLCAMPCCHRANTPPPCCTIGADHQDVATLAPPATHAVAVPVVAVAEAARPSTVATPVTTHATLPDRPLHLVNSVFLI